jgi:hypothetical protein
MDFFGRSSGLEVGGKLTTAYLESAGRRGWRKKGEGHRGLVKTIVNGRTLAHTFPVTVSRTPLPHVPALTASHCLEVRLRNRSATPQPSTQARKRRPWWVGPCPPPPWDGGSRGGGDGITGEQGRGGGAGRDVEVVAVTGCGRGRGTAPAAPDAEEQHHLEGQFSSPNIH